MFVLEARDQQGITVGMAVNEWIGAGTSGRPHIQLIGNKIDSYEYLCIPVSFCCCDKTLWKKYGDRIYLACTSRPPREVKEGTSAET